MYYAVRNGRETGVFNSWEECEKQVKGFGGAVFKKFSSKKEAQKFVNGEIHIKPPSTKQAQLTTTGEVYEFYVDGSYNNKKQIAGYGLVLVYKGRIIFRDIGGSHIKENTESKNVLGELKGAIKALDLAIANGFSNIIIYYDYLGIEKWATKEWRAKSDLAKYYTEIFEQRSKVINISFIKIKAHSGNPLNEEADRLARIGAGH